LALIASCSQNLSEEKAGQNQDDQICAAVP